MKIRPEFIEKWSHYLRHKEWDVFGGEGFRVWGHGDFPFVVSLIPDGVKNILEIGCADGYMLHLMKEKGMDPIGLTYSDGEKKCCDEHGLKAIVGDMHDLPFENQQFDAVISRQTIEHALSHVMVLCEMNRVTKIGGYNIMHVPYAINCDEDVNKDNRWHFCAFSPEQWKYFLKMFGFSKVLSEGRTPEQGAWWVVTQKTHDYEDNFKDIKNVSLDR